MTKLNTKMRQRHFCENQISVTGSALNKTSASKLYIYAFDYAMLMELRNFVDI